MEDFRCENPDILSRIEENPDFLYEFFNFQTNNICFANSKMRATISRYNIVEAYTLYKKDIKRLEKIENAGEEIEQYKKLAFLVYWLRRLSPITAILGSHDKISVRNPTEQQKFLAIYANEFCAFDIGFRIGRFIASRNVELDCESPTRLLLALDKDTRIGPEEIRYYSITKKHLIDVCAMLKEKNVSPHSLYLLFSSYFSLPTKKMT